MRDRAWFIRLYGEIIHELKSADYRPYRRTNHALSHSYMILSVDLAHYGTSCAKDLGIRGLDCTIKFVVLSLIFAHRLNLQAD